MILLRSDTDRSCRHISVRMAFLCSVCVSSEEPLKSLIETLIDQLVPLIQAGVILQDGPDNSLKAPSPIPTTFKFASEP
ncbi:MAG: hypothetical protein CM15mP74_31240 [Halieaceae bacterium]|nr:MAG: hypothetical protein CM15mP74_31240 [Halieaceae bacterium]